MAGVFRLFLALLVVNEHISGTDAFGGFAVNAFFILSGFWVARMWEQKYRGGPVAAFWLARLWRIYPAFLIMLVVLGVQRGVVPPLSAANPLSPMVLHWLSPAWSLGPELQFYLIAPAVLWLFRGQRATLLILAVLVAACVFNVSHGVRAFTTYAAFFAVGAAAAEHGWRPSKGLVTASALLSAGFVFAVWWFDALRPIFFQGGFGFAMEGGAALAAAAAPFAIWTAQSRSWVPLDRTMGDASYALYLAHWPMIEALAVWSINGQEAWIFSLLAGVLLLVVDTWIQHHRDVAVGSVTMLARRLVPGRL